jgi:cytochrome b561
MLLRSTPTQWSSVLKLLHWLVALMVITLCIVGWVMKGMKPSPDKVQVYLLHKSTGLTVLALVLLRVSWRVFAGRPAELPMPRWQRTAAALTHAMLYVVLIAMPLSGWLFNSAANFPLRWYGLFAVPALTGPDPALKALAGTAHLTLFWLLFVLVLAHVAGALQHHYFDRDATLTRMWFARRVPRIPAAGDPP